MKVVFGFIFAVVITVTIGTDYDDCSQFKSMENIDYERMRGVWYLFSAMTIGYEYVDSKCVTYVANFNSTGSFTMIVNFIRNNKLHITNNVGNPVDGLRSKFFVITYTDFEMTEKFGRYMYLLDTDYDNYVVWGICWNQTAYVISLDTRKPTLDPKHMELAKRAIRANNLSDQMRPIDQHNC